MNHRSLAASVRPLVASLGLLACSSDDDTSVDDAAAEEARAPENTITDDTSDDLSEPVTPPSCQRGTLEPDFSSAPLAGVGVDASGVRAGRYIVSSTYLQLNPDARSTFDELIGPVLEDLQTRDGLMALSLGQSEACVALRTLAVWRDDAAMIAFVTSPAHTAAMSRVTDVSRGGSVVTHWEGDASSVSWEAAAEKLRASDGPEY
jgi:hypothetical protein